MSSVDNRVVEMQFNNRRFEQNAKETMSTLDRLKEKLRFRDTTRELEDFQSAADSFNLSRIAEAVEGIGEKFTLLGHIGQEAMERIARSAINAGQTLIKSITVDQIGAGMTKYEQETNVIQTIYGALKPKGVQLNEIYGTMEQLTAYSDETSYSYTQMADAVSKFVNAGVDLKDAEIAIEGISNAAALAGIGIHDAEIIYRNFADAIGRGGFQLQDWRSIKIAHMDTEWLKQAFIDEAMAQGKLDSSGRVKISEEKRNKKGEITQEAKYVDVNEDFEGSLRRGWLDNDVIQAVMFKYANRELEGFGKEAFAAAQNAKTFTDVLDAMKDAASTGWSRSFRLIFGDLEEAIAFFTPMANDLIGVINEFDEARNKMLEGWKNMGGRDSMLNSLKNLWDVFVTIKDIVAELVDTIFFNGKWSKPISLAAQATYGQVNQISVSLREFTGRIESVTKAFKDWILDTTNGGARLEKIKKIISGVFSIFKVGLDILSAIKATFFFLFDALKPTIEAIIDLFAEFGEDLTAVDINDNWNLLELVLDLVHALEPLTSRLPKVIKWIKKLYEQFKYIWKNNPRLVAFRKSITNVFKSVIKFIPTAIESLINFGKRFIEMIKNSDEWKTLMSNYNKYIKPFLSYLTVGATKFNNALSDFFNMDTSDENTLWGKIKKRFSAFDQLGPWLSEKWEELKKNFPWIKEVEDWWNTNPVVQEIKEWARKIGEALDAFLSEDTSGETSIVGKIKKRFEAMWGILGVWLEQKWNEYKKQFPILQKIEDFFTGFFSKFGKKETGVSSEEQNGVITFLQDIFDKVTEFVSNVTFGDVLKFIGVVVGLIEAFKIVRGFTNVKQLGKKVIEGFSSIIEGIPGLITTAQNTLKSIQMNNWAKIILAVAGGIWLLADAFVKLAQLDWTQVAVGLVSMGGLFVEEGAFLFFMTKVQEGGALAAGNLLTIQTMIALAGGMWILADALLKVSRLSWTEVATGLTDMAGLFAITGAFMTLVNRLGTVEILTKHSTVAGSLITGVSKTSDLTKYARGTSGILAIAGAMWLLADVLLKLSKLSWTEVATGLADMAGLFAITGAFMILVNRLGTAEILTKNSSVGTGLIQGAQRTSDVTKYARGTSGILAVAGAMWILADALLKVSGQSWTEVGIGLGTMGGLFAETGAFMILVKNLGTVETFTTTGGIVKRTLGTKGILGVAISMWILCNAFTKVCNLGWDSVAEGLTVIGGLFVEQGVFMVLVNNLGAVEKGMKGGVSFLGVLGTAVSIYILGEELQKLSQIPWEELKNGLGAMALLFAEEGAFMVVVGLLSKKELIDASATISTGAIAFGIGKLADSFTKLTDLDLDQIGRASLALGAIEGLLLAYQAVLGLLKGTKFTNAISIALIAGSIKIMIDAFVPLAQADLNLAQVGTSLLALVGIGIVLGALSFVFSMFKVEMKTAISALIIAAALSLAMVAFAYSLSLIKDVEPGQIIVFAAAMLIVAVALIGLMAAVRLFGDMSPKIAIKGALIIVIVAAALAAAVALMLGITGQAIENFSNNIAVVGANLSQYSDQVQNVDNEATNNSVELLKTISLAFAEIGLRDYGNLTTFKTTLTQMGSSLRLFSMTTSEVDPEKMKSITTALKDMSNDLSEFKDVSDVSTSIGNIAGALKLYSSSFDGTEDWTKIPDSTVIKTVFDSLSSALPNDENLAGAAAYATESKGNDMTNFAIGLTNIATAVSDFSKNAKDLDFDNIQKATDALTAIATINTKLRWTSIKQIGPFAVEVNEQKSTLTTFAEDVVSLGTALKAFGDSISQVSADDLTTGVTILGKIGDLNTALPKTGGISQWFTGTQDLTHFAANLKLLGTGAKSFGEAIAGSTFDPAQVTAAGDALLAIAKVNNELPVTGGISSWFTGDSDLSGFGNSLDTLGKGVVKFADAIGSKEFGPNVDSAIGIVERFATSQSILKTGTGSKTLNALADEMDKSASSIVKMNDKLKNVTWNNTEKFEHIMNYAVRKRKTLPGSTGSGLDDLASELDNAAYYIVEMNNKLANVTWNNTDQFERLLTFAIDKTNSITAVASGSTTKSMKSIGSDIKDFLNEVWGFTTDWLGNDTGKLTKVSDAITSIFGVINDTLTGTENSSKLETDGESIIAEFVKGLTNETSISKVTSGINTICADISNVVKDNEQNFVNVGTWIPAGLGKGIKENKYAAINAAIEVMNETIEAAEKTAGIESPSKEFGKIGMYSDLGLAEGLLGSVNVVNSAADEVSQNALDTVLGSMMDINNLPLDEIDVTPQIRPVLDVSDISGKAGMIDGILGESHTVSFDTRQLEAQAQVFGDENATDLSSITAQVVDLNAKLEELKGVVGNLKVVLNNGALVGGLMSDLDKAFGARARRGERGV